MDILFQDRIDEYLLHQDRMSDEDKAAFLREMEEDADKREQYETTLNMIAALTSREDKMSVLREFERRYIHDNTPAAKHSQMLCGFMSQPCAAAMMDAASDDIYYNSMDDCANSSALDSSALDSSALDDCTLDDCTLDDCTLDDCTLDDCALDDDVAVDDTPVEKVFEETESMPTDALKEDAIPGDRNTIQPMDE